MQLEESFWLLRSLARSGRTILSQQVPQGRIVQDGVGQQPLQARVLVLQRLQPLGLRHLQPAELGLPLVEAASLTPCLPHRSATDAPASCSFKIQMIWFCIQSVSLNPLRAHAAGTLLLFVVGEAATWWDLAELRVPADRDHGFQAIVITHSRAS
ncbi:hypothetical protein ACVWXM_009682 [Bradyrhizobium sp. GM7.3]